MDTNVRVISSLVHKSFGRRLSRLRKELSYTQVELAAKIRIIQALVSDYERDKLRPHADMIIRFVRALDVAADELRGLTPSKTSATVQNRRFVRRLQQIDKLWKRDQDALLRASDAFLGKSKE